MKIPFQFLFIFLLSFSTVGYGQTAKTYFDSGSEKVNYRVGDYKGAIIDLNKAISLNPKYAEAYYKRGEAKYQLEDKIGALADYNKSIEIDAKYVYAYVERGKIKYQLKDSKGAISDYTKAIELDPKYIWAYRCRGDAKIDHRDYKGAIADYIKALEIDDTNDVKINNTGGNSNDPVGNTAGIIDNSIKTIFIDPDFENAYLLRAEASVGRFGDNEGAKADYTKILELNPKNAKAYLGRGDIKIDLGDPMGAIADFTKLIEINPLNAIAYSRRGYARSHAEDWNGGVADYSGAIADYTKVIELDTKDESAYNEILNISDAKIKIKDYSGAIADLTKIIMIKPNYEKAYEYRSRARYQLKDYTGAIDDNTKIIEINPKNASAYYNRGALKIKIGQNESGCLDLNKAGDLGDTGALAAIKKVCRNSIENSKISSNKTKPNDLTKTDTKRALDVYNITKVQEFYWAQIYGKGYTFIQGKENTEGGILTIDRKKNLITLMLGKPISLKWVEDAIDREAKDGIATVILTTKFKLTIIPIYKIGDVKLYNIKMLYDFSSKLDQFTKYVSLSASLSNGE